MSTMLSGNTVGSYPEALVDIGGKNYAIASGDNYLDHIKKGFEPETVRLFKSLANHSDVVLDIGANIGCTALLLSSLSKSVYAFEPSPTTFSFLQRNIAKSGVKNIFPQNFGLGDEPGEYTIAFAPSNRSGGFISNRILAHDGLTAEKIVVRPLDEAVQLLNLSKIDFIKIDVEGFEGQVLRGGAKSLQKYRPVTALELNHWCLNAIQRTSVPDFLDLLRSIFPILLAVDGSNYLDLHDHNDSYVVMYHHILHMRFGNIVAAFDESQLERFRKTYQHKFVP